AFNELFDDQGTMDQRLNMVANDFSENPAVMQIIDFARLKTRFPLCSPQRK
ncbi:MAG TPA: acyl-[acyl-carrier-protein]--UDP-N-acetylglucosamine O-acyltransferase, partial [Rhodospirillaceae bacterium]|nr:acyl-[acyl-carrier-protein]--UDP-N-acetylglucosamine O-acyltransferase [Rhodospirillaceae bacterium]